MKTLYWRPTRVSRVGLTLVSLIALLGLFAVHRFPVSKHPQLENGTWMAAATAQRMFTRLRAQRVHQGLEIDEVLDPGRTGMIGASMSIVTSRPSHLSAKQTSVNPNFAAVAVDLLWQAGVRPGDTVAIGWTGSFPALNVAMCAAVEAMDLQPIIVASATSSQYGANLPQLMWLDMEASLRDAGLTRCRSTLLSFGGVADRGVGLSDESIAAIRDLASRHDVPLMETNSRAASVERRMDHYAAKGVGPIKAYINVGGGVASLGGAAGRSCFHAGLNQKPNHRHLADLDCVMARFAGMGTPLIHLGDVERLANQFQLSIAPSTMPDIGQGRPFSKGHPNRYLATTVLVVIGLALQFGVLRVGGHRLRLWIDWVRNRRSQSAASEATMEPQLMV